MNNEDIFKDAATVRFHKDRILDSIMKTLDHMATYEYTHPELLEYIKELKGKLMEGKGIFAIVEKAFHWKDGISFECNGCCDAVTEENLIEFIKEELR